MKNKTVDELLEIIAWAKDRARYRRTCNIINPVAYANDCKAEADATRELARRGNPHLQESKYKYGLWLVYPEV